AHRRHRRAGRLTLRAAAVRLGVPRHARAARPPADHRCHREVHLMPGIPASPARLPRLDHIAYGGDYSPEQWPREVWTADHAAFDVAGITTLTVGVFTWALTQPSEDEFDFSVLDDILQRAADEGRRICLGTGTGAMPPWLVR